MIPTAIHRAEGSKTKQIVGSRAIGEASVAQSHVSETIAR